MKIFRKSLLMTFLALSSLYFMNIFFQPTSSREIQNYPTPTVEKCEKRTVVFSYYNPLRGGINCDDDCRYTASGKRILDDKNNPISSYWWNGEDAGVACPQNYNFGTVFEITFPDGTKSKFECIDRGGQIIEENNITRLDILHNDGNGPYSWPVTKRGYRITKGPYEACVHKP
ncbi:MAG: hypothetical protein KQA41_01250 [Candidatus Aenigmarchaeota archaeon]|nr:hypothetical protein [Candidatus Aenigmarchaeota archaeon]MBU5688837.1 hypothetical protein [Candidatus Aenigmarchaeota archaeon]